MFLHLMIFVNFWITLFLFPDMDKIRPTALKALTYPTCIKRIMLSRTGNKMHFACQLLSAVCLLSSIEIWKLYMYFLSLNVYFSSCIYFMEKIELNNFKQRVNLSHFLKQIINPFSQIFLFLCHVSAATAVQPTVRAQAIRMLFV